MTPTAGSAPDLTPDEIRARVDAIHPRVHDDGSINAAHVAAEQTLRSRHKHPDYIAELDGPGKFRPAAPPVDVAADTREDAPVCPCGHPGKAHPASLEGACGAPDCFCQMFGEPAESPADTREETVARALWEADDERILAHFSAEQIDAMWAAATGSVSHRHFVRLARAAISADPGPDTADQLRQRVHDLADELAREFGEYPHSVTADSLLTRLRAVAGPRRDETPNCAWCDQKATGTADSNQGRLPSCGHPLHQMEGTYRRDEEAGQ